MHNGLLDRFIYNTFFEKKRTRSQYISRCVLFATVYLCIAGFRLPNFVDYANELLFRCPWHLNEPGRIISSTGKFGLRLEPRPFCSKRHTYRCSCRRAIKRHYSGVIAPPTGMGIVISAPENFSAIKQVRTWTK